MSGQILTHLSSGTSVILRSGKPQIAFPLAEAVVNGFIREKRPTTLALEQSLLDEDLRFGGTFDGVFAIDGAIWVVDWKTSNQISEDYKEQLAAYAHMWNKAHPDQPVDDGVIVRVDKNARTPYLEIVYYKHISAYFPAFKRKLDAWWANAEGVASEQSNIIRRP